MEKPIIHSLTVKQLNTGKEIEIQSESQNFSLGDYLVEQIVQFIASKEGLDENFIQLIKENGMNVENK